MNQVATLPKRSLVDSMAAKYEMEPAAFIGAIKATVIKGDCSNEQFAAFLMVAKEYDLNPLTKEIYAFPDRGGITPIVSIDGWMNLINSHPQFDGMEFVDTEGADGKLYSVECKMYRKDRQRPTTVIEYMSECFRQTDPWKKWPNRMLRHKAAIQCARYAFGFSGIMEPDEFDRMKDVTPSTPEAPSIMQRFQAAQEPQEGREGFDPDFVRTETESFSRGNSDPETGEIIDQPDDADGPSSTVEASGAGDGALPPESPAPILVRYAREVLNYAVKPDITSAALAAIEKRWAGEIDALDDEGKEKARAIARSMRSVFNDPAMYDGVIEHYAEMLGCSAEDLGRAG